MSWIQSTMVTGGVICLTLLSFLHHLYLASYSLARVWQKKWVFTNLNFIFRHDGNSKIHFNPIGWTLWPWICHLCHKDVTVFKHKWHTCCIFSQQISAESNCFLLQLEYSLFICQKIPACKWQVVLSMFIYIFDRRRITHHHRTYTKIVRHLSRRISR